MVTDGVQIMNKMLIKVFLILFVIKSRRKFLRPWVPLNVIIFGGKLFENRKRVNKFSIPFYRKMKMGIVFTFTWKLSYRSNFLACLYRCTLLYTDFIHTAIVCFDSGVIDYNHFAKQIVLINIGHCSTGN